MSETLARIPLDRRVCIVQSDRIDLRQERAAIVGPTLGLIVSAVLFAAMAFWSNHLPLGPLAVMLLAALILTRFSGMAFVYSLLGAAEAIAAMVEKPVVITAATEEEEGRSQDAPGVRTG